MLLFVGSEALVHGIPKVIVRISGHAILVRLGIAFADGPNKPNLLKLAPTLFRESERNLVLL